MLLIGVLIAAMRDHPPAAPAGGAHGGGYGGPAAIPVVHTLTTDPPTGSLTGNLGGGPGGWPGQSDRGSRGTYRRLGSGAGAEEHGHHDSPRRIAERELGDGTRWSELYARNAGIPQADGRALVRPELIQPGWQLAVPTTAQQNGPNTTTPAQAAPLAHAPSS